MNDETHAAATRALEAVLLDRAIVGMYFAFSNLWFNDPKKPGGEDAYLRIGNGWSFLNAAASGITPSEVSRDYRELAQIAAGLAEARVKSIRLDVSRAHLWLVFETGDTLFINGWHDQYESWELSAGEYLVVALAAGDLAIWSPSEKRPPTRSSR